MMGIWDTLQPPTPVEEAVVVPEEQVKEHEKVEVQAEEKQWLGLPVRADSDRVYLLKGGQRHWVTNAEVYSKLGFKFGDEQKIDRETLIVIPEGEPIR